MDKVFIITEDDQEYGYHCLAFGDGQSVTPKQVFRSKEAAEAEVERLHHEYFKNHFYYKETGKYPHEIFYVDERKVY